MTQMVVNISDWTRWPSDRLWLVDLFDAAPNLDVLGLNTYPFKVYDDPDDVPASHYLNVTKHTEKPLIFTEVGWPSGAEYFSSEHEQPEFLSRFLNVTASMNVLGVCWISMHDFAVAGPYEDHVLSWGLRDVDSNPKEAWYLWMNMKALPVVGAARYLVPALSGGGGGEPGFTMAHLFLVSFAVLGAAAVVVVAKKKRG